MIVYLSIFIVLSVIGIAIPNKSSTPFFIIVGMFLIWFMGARNYVGCDFTGYLNRFYGLPTYEGFWRVVLREEPGFQFIIASVKMMGWSYMWLNVFSSVIMVVCIIYFCRNFAYSLLILALFFSNSDSPTWNVWLAASFGYEYLAYRICSVYQTACYRNIYLGTGRGVVPFFSCYIFANCLSGKSECFRQKDICRSSCFGADCCFLSQ